MPLVKHNKDSASYHPTQSESHRHAVDTLLRKYGFRILVRKRKEEPYWERYEDGCWVVYSQKDAVKELNFNELQDAVYQEELYLDSILEGW